MVISSAQHLIMQTLCQSCPKHFISNSVATCREQSLQEVLEISFGMLKGSYLAYFGQQLQSAASWQAAEAALFAIR